MFRKTEIAKYISHNIKVIPKLVHDSIQDAALDLTSADKELLKLIESNILISQSEMSKILQWKIGKVKYYINKLKRKRVIERVGSSQKGYWNILIDTKLYD